MVFMSCSQCKSKDIEKHLATELPRYNQRYHCNKWILCPSPWCHAPIKLIIGDSSDHDYIQCTKCTLEGSDGYWEYHDGIPFDHAALWYEERKDLLQEVYQWKVQVDNLFTLLAWDELHSGWYDRPGIEYDEELASLLSELRTIYNYFEVRGY